jgi:hypothetical protein
MPSASRTPLRAPSAATRRTEEDLGEAVRPYLQRITEEGRYPHFVRWANAPGRFDPVPRSFERVLDWLLEGIDGTLVNSG